jgi:hypothetical protein
MSVICTYLEILTFEKSVLGQKEVNPYEEGLVVEN